VLFACLFASLPAMLVLSATLIDVATLASRHPVAGRLRPISGARAR
jgi:hypothetical protein